ncbi:MAG: response regulator, partial [Candidatus Paceibacterota bacterium]
MKEVRVLLVDKDECSVFFVTHLLKKNGFDDLVVVNNGFDALNQIKNQQFDLILTELMVPGIGGFELIKQVRLIPEYKNTTIITITTLSHHREECFKVGATDFIIKPIFNSLEFIRRIKTHI